MLTTLIVSIVYLIDHWAGWIFYLFGWLNGKLNRLRIIMFRQVNNPCQLEISYLREEVRRLKAANMIMREELNRVKSKRPCLCRKLQMVWFKLRFGVSLRKVRQYLPVSKTALINYLNQLRSGISNLAPRVRGYHNALNRTPVSITMLIRQIRLDNPHWGRWRIALAVWKIGVYVSPSTVRNILNSPEPDSHRPDKKQERIKMKAINGKYPNHIWSVDLTTVYVCFRPLYILAILDHYSRKAMALTTTFNPTADWVIKHIQELIGEYGRPKHLISDYGTQFTAGEFTRYVRQQGIFHRYARVSKANGNSKVERFFRSLKYELLNLYLFFSKAKADKLLKEYLTYYNEYRPHEGLDGQVPNDVYSGKARDKPTKDAKSIKGDIETIVLGDGLLKAYRLKKVA